MILYPAIFIALMQFVFNAIDTDESIVDDNITVLFNATMWTSPDDTKYETFFGNDPIGWFADNMYVAILKVVAVFVIVGVTLFPFIDLASIIPITLTGILTTLFVFCYAMMGMGGYKVLSPFVGR